MTRFLPISTVILFFGLGCTSIPKDTCPTIGNEPISGCRARAKCRQKKIIYGVGLSPSGQVAENFGLAPETSPATEKYLECITKDLKLQKSLSEVKQQEENIIDR